MDYQLFFFIGCILILQDLRNFKRTGIIILLISYVLVLFIPYELGYYLYESSDAITHLGIIKNIISTSQIEPSNIYPATHILFAITSLISNVEPNITSLLLPLFSQCYLLLECLFIQDYLSITTKISCIV